MWIFLSELDEQPPNDTNGDDDDEEDFDDPDDDESDGGVENPVGQITLQNGNRIDRGSAGALTKSRSDAEVEDQVDKQKRQKNKFIICSIEKAIT